MDNTSDMNLFLPKNMLVSNTEQESSVSYHEYQDAYYQVLDKTADFFRDYDIQDPFRISLVYEYLLWNGYFSKNRSLVYSMEGRNSVPNCLGADIMRGKSVCFNNSDMHIRLLNSLGYPSLLLACYTNERKKVRAVYQFPVHRKHAPSSSKTPIETMQSYIFGNHVITLFSFQNRYYGYDSTAGVFLEPNFGKRLTFFGSNQGVTVKKNPSISINLNEQFCTTPNEFTIAFSKLQQQKLQQEKYLTPQFMSNLNLEMLHFCNANRTLFDDFHESIQPEIQTINKTLRR